VPLITEDPPCAQTVDVRKSTTTTDPARAMAFNIPPSLSH
jgi:hypothetical protein